MQTNTNSPKQYLPTTNECLIGSTVELGNKLDDIAMKIKLLYSHKMNGRPVSSSEITNIFKHRMKAPLDFPDMKSLKERYIYESEEGDETIRSDIIYANNMALQYLNTITSIEAHSNSFSLFGFCIMIYYYPYFYYEKYNYLLNTNLIIFNLICIFVHIIPLYLFNNKNKINNSNIDITITNTIFILLIYYLLFNSILKKMYPFSDTNLILLVIFLLVILYMVYIQ
jgi:hypothetical protein